MSDVQPVVEFFNVSKRYGRALAVGDLTFSINKGSVTAILGRNGAGKTTTIALLLGMVHPSIGSVALMNRDPTQPVTRSRVGAMLQRSGAPETLRVNELIRLWSSYYLNPLPQDEVIARAGLSGIEKQRFGWLSGGQQRRVAFALALCGNPSLLVLDEPTTGLDVDARRGFWEQIRGFAASGGTVVFSTHYLEEADALADRILLMAQGRVIRDGSPDAIKQSLGSRQIRCVTRMSEDVLRQLPDVLDVEIEGRYKTILTKNAEPVVYTLLQRDSALTDLQVRDVALDEAVMVLTEDARESVFR